MQKHKGSQGGDKAGDDKATQPHPPLLLALAGKAKVNETQNKSKHPWPKLPQPTKLHRQAEPTTSKNICLYLAAVSSPFPPGSDIQTPYMGCPLHAMAEIVYPAIHSTWGGGTQGLVPPWTRVTT